MKYIFQIIFLSSFAIGFAQNSQSVNDTINNTVVVTRDYNPTIDDAEKISLSPEEKAQSLIQPPIRYIITPSMFQPEKETEEIKPEPVSVDLVSQQLNQNYVNIGVGTRSSIYNEVFYNAYQSETHNLNLYGFHNSSFGHIKLENDDKVFAPYMNTNAIIAYENRTKRAILSSNFQFKNQGFKYYGLDSISTNATYRSDDGTAVNGKKIKPTANQNYTNYAFNIGLRSQNNYAYEFRYKTKIDFYSHNNRQDLFEYKTGMVFDMSTPAGNNNFGLKLKSDYYFYRADDNFFFNRTFRPTDVLSIKIQPNYLIKKEHWHLLFGVNVATVQSGEDHSDFVVSPEIDASLNIIEDLFSVYAKLSGDHTYISFKEASERNPFIAHNVLLEPVKIPFTSKIGLNGYIYPDLFFNLNFGFDLFQNRAFYTNEVYNTWFFSDPTHSNRFIADYHDGSKFYVNSHILYQGFKNTEFGINFDYNSFNLKDNAIALHEPKFLVGTFMAHTFERYDLTLKAAYQYRSMQMASENLSDTKEIPEIHDINLEVRLEHSSRLSSFIKIHNLLNRQNYILNGYPMQGILGMVGVKYNF